MKKTVVLLIAFAIAAITGLACGGGEETTATATQEVVAPTATPTTIPATATATTVAPTPTATTTPTTTPPTPTSLAGASDTLERGRLLAQQKNCQGCHSTDGSSKLGPTWKGLYGAATELIDGSTVTANEEYLVESIKTPNAKIVQGFPPNIMPIYGLTDSEIDAIIAYIESLK